MYIITLKSIQNPFISTFSKSYGRKIIHHELIHVQCANLNLWDEYFGQGFENPLP